MRRIASRRWLRRTPRLLVAAILVLGPPFATTRAGATTPSASSSSTVASVWSEPGAGYGFLVAAINGAHRSIDLSMYELNDHTTEAALIDRARAGVDVRVLLDSAYLGKRENSSAASLLAAGGVHVAWAPTSQIFHAKYLVIDAHLAYIGTGNLVTSDYQTTRDFWVADSGTSDVAAITSTFSTDFSGHPGAGVASHGLVWSPGSTGTLVALINSAHTSLLVENEEMDSAAIEQALAGAARRGVDVEVVMTEDPSWTAALTELATAGDHVRILASSQLYIHAKVICTDCSARAGTVFVGSENFSTSSLAYNRELGVITTSMPAIEAVRTVVAADFATGHAPSVPTAPAPAADGTSAITITSFESTIAPGEEDTLSVSSKIPGESCVLSVRLPSGSTSASRGLGAATADPSGSITWHWKIGTSTKGGTATASISCNSGSTERTFTIS